MKKTIISITSGDADGIGLEVTMKALNSYHSSKSTFIIYRNSKSQKKCWKDLPKRKTLQVTNLGEALSEAHNTRSPYRYIELKSSDNPAKWVEQSTKSCLKGELHGIVTGPVSKKSFIDANLNTLGHTPLFKKLCGVPEVYMGFLGSHFNVILLTGHIPIHEVEKSLSPDAIKLAFNIIPAWQRQLPKYYSKKPLGVLGLNPHSGEDGLIGGFEKKILYPILSSHKNLVGPLIPDVAFQSDFWGKFSFYIALYHDQGLIPFKMIHTRSSSCHVSVGLPIVRTSVDHGTAKDIFGLGKAHPGSMISAIQWCEKLINKKER